jgi:hypothetical protein
MSTVLISILLMGLVIVMLSLTLLLKKNGKFPDTHIEDNQYLQKQGITCALQDEFECCSSNNKITDTCAQCSITVCEKHNQN